MPSKIVSANDLSAVMLKFVLASAKSSSEVLWDMAHNLSKEEFVAAILGTEKEQQKKPSKKSKEKAAPAEPNSDKPSASEGDQETPKPPSPAPTTKGFGNRKTNPPKSSRWAETK